MLTLQNWIYIRNSDRFERFICFRCTSDSTRYKKALITKEIQIIYIGLILSIIALEREILYW